MRAVFTVLGLVVVLGVVGVLAKKQLDAGVAPKGAESVEGVVVPAGTPQQQVQQFQKAAESALQQTRPMPDESK
jgi:hypothetical protein